MRLFHEVVMICTLRLSPPLNADPQGLELEQTSQGVITRRTAACRASPLVAP